jgi:hypothetical protein
VVPCMLTGWALLEACRYLMKRVYKRHANAVPVMAKGVEEFKRSLTHSVLDELPEIHQFLDRCARPGRISSGTGLRALPLPRAASQQLPLQQQNKDWCMMAYGCIGAWAEQGAEVTRGVG